VAAAIPAAARHLRRARVALPTRVAAQRRAAQALAQGRKDQTGRAVTARTAIAVHAAVATSDARVGRAARGRRSTGARDARLAVRIAEALIVRASRIVEGRSRRVLAAAIRSGFALGIHVAEAALAHAGTDIGAGVGARARAGGQRRDGAARLRARRARGTMILRNATCVQACGGRTRGPRRAACRGDVRGACVACVACVAACILQDRRVEKARASAARVARGHCGAATARGRDEQGDRKIPGAAHVAMVKHRARRAAFRAVGARCRRYRLLPLCHVAPGAPGYGARVLVVRAVARTMS
jgi:hypothetical protein